MIPCDHSDGIGLPHTRQKVEIEIHLAGFAHGCAEAESQKDGFAKAKVYCYERMGGPSTSLGMMAFIQNSLLTLIYITYAHSIC
jgi:hypothetical protein